MVVFDKVSVPGIILGIVFAFGFLVFLAPVFTGIINVGNGAGMALCAVLAFVSMFWGRLYPVISNNKSLRIFVSVIAGLAAVLIVAAVVISVLMIRTADSTVSEENGGTVIVLGCRVKGDVPSLMLYRRINAAYEYLEKNPGTVCIASGGQGGDELISEAECIKNVLVERGISPDRIIMEDKSTSTDENIRFSMEKMEENGISGGAVIVTNDYHQLRAKMICQKYGLETSAVSAETSMYLLPTYWVREWFGVVYQFFFG
ncbi:MAG: YdcF family protein [Oscillospiraceae bacterium]|nr:YdcF family protein [Oscillospiraceae bacterium]